jgi:hypothetical protein
VQRTVLQTAGNPVPSSSLIRPQRLLAIKQPAADIRLRRAADTIQQSHFRGWIKKGVCLNDESRATAASGSIQTRIKVTSFIETKLYQIHAI